MTEPALFSDFKANNPDSDWKKGFKKNAGAEANQAVNDKLKQEQYGLCVYCEIDLKSNRNQGLDDFRVEHFFPENPKPDESRNDGINYALHWPNLFGCCSGGNVPHVIEKDTRYSNPHTHCDVPKSNNDWTNIILNPILDIPAFPSLFKFSEDGEIFVSDECDTEIQVKVENTIKFLNLNTKKLQRFRKEIITSLRQELISSNDISETLDTLAKANLLPNDNGNISPFFTTIRWYLGDNAEDVLLHVNYDG